MDNVSTPPSPIRDEDNESLIPTRTIPVIYITRFAPGAIIHINDKTRIECDMSCAAFHLLLGGLYHQRL
jgi:hypothetical protein